MSDRIDPSTWPSLRGPWHEVEDLTRLYDHGRAWCAGAAGHPDHNGGYPDPDRHLPWHECRTVETYLEHARRDLHGREVDLSVYGATRFRFGEPRQLPVHAESRRNSCCTLRCRRSALSTLGGTRSG